MEKAVVFTLMPLLFAAVCCSRPEPQGRSVLVARVAGEDPAAAKALYAGANLGFLDEGATGGVRNASVYLGSVEEGVHFLFGYFEGNRAAEAGSAFRRGAAPGPWIRMEEVFHFDGDSAPSGSRRRFGSVLGIEKKDILAYTQLHSAVWPKVLKAINDAHIRNFSIFLGEVEKDRFYLFSYYEYAGRDFEADMARNASDEVTRLWWTYTEPLQRPVPTRRAGEWWHVMEELAHVD